MTLYVVYLFFFPVVKIRCLSFSKIWCTRRTHQPIEVFCFETRQNSWWRASQALQKVMVTSLGKLPILPLCAVWLVFENDTLCSSSSFMGERFCCKWIGKAMNNYRLFAWFWHVPIFLLRKAVFSILMLFYSVLWNSHLSNLLLNWTPRVISEYFSAIIFPGCSYDLIDVNKH